jgi:hypothetical protein
MSIFGMLHEVCAVPLRLALFERDSGLRRAMKRIMGWFLKEAHSRRQKEENCEEGQESIK